MNKSLIDKIHAWMRKQGFNRATWDFELTGYCPGSDQPFGGQEFPSTVCEEWRALENEVRDAAGEYEALDPFWFKHEVTR